MGKRVLGIIGSLAAASLVLTALLLLVSGRGLADSAQPPVAATGDTGAAARGWIDDLSVIPLEGGEGARPTSCAQRALGPCAGAGPARTPVDWHSEVEHVQTGERWAFDTLEELLAFLPEETGKGTVRAILEEK